VKRREARNGNSAQVGDLILINSSCPSSSKPVGLIYASFPNWLTLATTIEKYEFVEFTIRNSLLF